MYKKRIKTNLLLISLAIGISFIALSIVYASSFLAVFGVSLVFWSGLLFYIVPVTSVPLTLFNVSADASVSNIEHLLIDLNINEAGIYLPPQNLAEFESSLIFLPKIPQTKLPTAKQTDKNLMWNAQGDMFLIPPGLPLSRFFERELNISFFKTNLDYIQKTLPNLLVENLEIAEQVEIKVQDNTIVIKLRNSIFNSLCKQTDMYPKTHSQVGCLLASAIACVLAKATAKPIIIKKEYLNFNEKEHIIEYQMMEE